MEYGSTQSEEETGIPGSVDLFSESDSKTRSSSDNTKGSRQTMSSGDTTDRDTSCHGKDRNTERHPRHNLDKPNPRRTHVSGDSDPDDILSDLVDFTPVSGLKRSRVLQPPSPDRAASNPTPSRKAGKGPGEHGLDFLDSLLEADKTKVKRKPPPKKMKFAVPESVQEFGILDQIVETGYPKSNHSQKKSNPAHSEKANTASSSGTVIPPSWSDTGDALGIF